MSVAEDTTLILDAVDRFIERDVEPYAHDLEAEDAYPHEIVERMKELGLFGATIAPEFGGLGLSAATYASIIERITAAWMSVSGIINSHLIMAAAVQRFGTDQQKQRFLPRFATGELRGGIALTEPDCGTDLQAVRTRAERKGNAYVVNGTKTWITNSVEGDLLAVLVKTDPEAEPRHRGMSLLLIEKGEGISARKLGKLGYRGVDTGEVVIEDCQVPFDNLIGGEEGRGLQQILAGLELGRINVAARGVGLARACLDKALAYAQLRKTFGKPIAEHQSVQIMLADMATRVEAARLLTESAGRAYDKGERCDMEAGMAKLFATEAAVANSLEAMRIHGAYGYSKEFDIERYYRDAPLLAIGEGTNELQRLIIARQAGRTEPGLSAMLPLEGVRVLAVEQYGAGPFGTAYLADQGAEVIKIENPRDGGDMARAVGPYFFGPGDSQFFHSFNRNKKSLTLDLTREEGQTVLHDLVAGADALACNLRGDVPGKLGLSYDALKAHNRQIVCAHLTAYGRDGPRGDWPGFDYLMQAEAGWFSLTGDPEGPPARFGLSVVDMMTGLAMAYALLAGADGCAGDGRGARRRCESVRRGAPQPRLSRHLVPERRRQPGAPAALGPSLAHALPALPHRRRLDLHHVQQGEVLAGAVPRDRASRMGRGGALPELQGAPGEPRSDRRTARRRA